MIDINQNYTQIRNQALRQANKIKGGHDKELRTAPGTNNLYLKTNKSNIVGWNNSLRTSKREGVASGLKQAIDREFGNLKIDGRTLGDLVFARLEDQGHDTKLLKASDFKLIDQAIADELRDAASSAPSQHVTDEINAHAEHFEWLARSGATGRGTTQMESKANAALQFKEAIAKDAMLAGATPDRAREIADGLQSHLYNDDLDIAAGVKPKHIDKARELMSSVGINNTPNLNEIAHEQNLRTKMYSTGKQMHTSLNRLRGSNDNQVKALANHGDATLKGLKNYLANPNGPRPNFGAEFTRNLQLGHAILARLEQSDNPDNQLINELRTYLNVTSEMATATLPPEQRYNIALRPPQVLVSNNQDPT
ncbi:MAG: hypothetical protein V2J55_19510, partial [Candidatus Competibacteraceae bacterium]|nr:hypothetical protein [Candidatus Competibacteraceae bacterium]